MKATILFVTGMFRSGTTLLGRMLNAHPRITVASDPYLPFFKVFRSQTAQMLGNNIDSDYPLQDYYFSAEGVKLLRTIQHSSLNVPFNFMEISELREQIRAYGMPYSPKIMEQLNRLQGGTYAELFLSMIDLIHDCYSQNEDSVIGFKSVWADEFIPSIAASFPDAKFVQIVRDPRAVCASKNVLPARYPWLFLTRQWRKLGTLAWKYQQDPELTKKVYMVRFEDLITEPKRIAQEICDFFGVEYTPEMTDPHTYVDGKALPWRQNTSFGKGLQSFDKNASERWREVLTSHEVTLIEFLCGPEMELFEYYPEQLQREAYDKLLLTAPRIDDEKIAQWIVKIVPNDYLTIAVELAKERLRSELLSTSDDDLEEVDETVIEGSFLFLELFESLRGRDIPQRRIR